jgi:membrane fusion protein (multidrug efflux system)
MKRHIMILGLCAMLFQMSCETKKVEKEVETKYLVTSPVKMDTSITKDYVCQVRSIRHIDIMAQERGYLQKIFVDEGQIVKQGQMLFQITPALYNAEVQKAEAEVNFADIECQNTKRLADSNVVAPNELAMAKAKLARVHLQFTEIRAPFDGIIDKFHLKLGSLVNEGELLTNLSDNSQVWVYFNVPEAEYIEYKEHAKSDSKVQVNLIMANNEMFNHIGVVETIEADFNNETGNIAFRATFPNPEALLRHGETGNIRMHVPVKNAIIIPQKATFEVLDKRYVFVIDKDNRVKSKEITIGADMEDLFIVTGGLSENDKILLEGLRKVKENDKISFEYEDPKNVMTHLKVHAE